MLTHTREWLHKCSVFHKHCTRHGSFKCSGSQTASEVTTLWRYRNVCIVIIIKSHMLTHPGERPYDFD